MHCINEILPVFILPMVSRSSPAREDLELSENFNVESIFYCESRNQVGFPEVQPQFISRSLAGSIPGSNPKQADTTQLFFQNRTHWPSDGFSMIFSPERRIEKRKGSIP